MSLTNPTNVVIEERLKEFYDRIFPYLGGKASAGFTPVGTLIAVMGVTAPANYLACDGTVYNIADYPELANYFYQQFGSKNKFGGNGTTTFAVPDLRGEFLRGTGANSHADQGNGSSVGTHQDATEFPHIGVNPGNGTSDGSAGSARIQFKSKAKNGNTWQAVGNRDNVIPGTAYLWQNLFSSSSGSEDGSVAFTTRPTNTSVLFCIATKNIYLNPKNDYSTEEKVIGTWIDGKTLYQRTITGTSPADTTSGVTQTIAVDSSINRVISIEGFIEESTVGVFYMNSRNNAETKHIYIWFNRQYDSTPPQLRLYLKSANDFNSRPYYITIQYTKTTT